MKTMNLDRLLELLTLSLICNFAMSQNAIQIDSVIGSFRDAIRITYAGDDGISIFSAGGDGINVDRAGSRGVYVFSAGGDGFHVRNAGFHGVHVVNAGNDGVYVENADGWSLNIQGDKNLATGLEGHIAQIYNRSTGTSPDVLALKVRRTANPGSGVNFITFYKGDDVGVGRIEGNGMGGVTYGTSGADYAESLPRLSEEEGLEAGDIVRVFEGKVTRRTNGATQLMVITDRPAVFGNQIDEDSDLYEKVSFVGQVGVRVRGVVQSGDWIIVSKLEDGTGIAVSQDEIAPGDRIVGRAWENHPDPGIKRVNTVVGLDQSEAKDAVIKRMQMQLLQLQQQVDELKNLVQG